MFSQVFNYTKGIILICNYFSNICEILGSRLLNDFKVKLLKSLQVCRSDKNLILVVNYFNTLPLTMKDKSEMKT